MSDWGDLALALGADSLWLQDEASGTTIDDSGPEADDLTLTGSGYTLQDDTGFTGVGDGINYDGAAYAIITSALKQVVTDQFSFAGFFNDNANPGAFSQPWFCASQVGGHADPFYTFALLNNGSNQYRIALDTGIGFSPVDTGIGIIATGGWHMFALVYNGATIKLYVDGSEVFSTARTGNVGDMGSFALACIPALNSTTYTPDIRSSNAAYWSDYALTAGDVSDLWDARNGAPCVSPTNAGGTNSPSVSGTPEVGETLTANPGFWSGDATITYAYQWYRLCGTNEELISGATSITYEVTEDDIGCEPFVRVTATNGCAPDGEADSDPVGPVPDLPPSNLTAPVISGVPQPGHTLTGTNGTWSGGGLSFTYQWSMDCSTGYLILAGETASTLLLEDEMVGCTVILVVTATNGEGSDSAVSNAIEVQANIPAAIEICEAPPWRFVVTDLNMEVITWLDRLARNRQIAYTLNDTAMCTGTVPSDDPRINIPHTDGDPYFSEGNRLLFGFRYEPISPTVSAWVIRYGGIILQVQDAAQQDNADTSFTAYDPWQYLRSRPVRNGVIEGFTLPGLNGSSYTQTRINEIAGLILKNTIVTDGPVFIDAGWEYGGTYFYEGTMEDCDRIDINFAQGTTVGQAWDELVSGNQADFVLTPIWDPERRPGYTHELSIYTQAGAIIDNAIFGWDQVPRNLIGVNRLIEGSGRANKIKFFAGQAGLGVGGQAIQVQTDPVSVAKYGEYWYTQFFPGQNVALAVEAFAAATLEIRKTGRRTVDIAPSPDCATSLFQAFFLGDRVPVYASNRLREELQGYQRIYGISLQIGDDSTETIDRMLASKEGFS